jgi:hypothetical protein
MDASTHWQAHGEPLLFGKAPTGYLLTLPCVLSDRTTLSSL